MKNINLLTEEFKQISNPIDNNYIKLGDDLAQVIILMPKNEQVMAWEFVSNKFSEKEIELITNGASICLKTEDQKKNFADGMTKINESISSLDDNISILNQITDSDGSIKQAINALEELKRELNKKHIKPIMH
jgi:hypothetical protein